MAFGGLFICMDRVIVAIASCLSLLALSVDLVGVAVGLMLFATVLFIHGVMQTRLYRSTTVVEEYEKPAAVGRFADFFASLLAHLTAFSVKQYALISLLFSAALFFYSLGLFEENNVAFAIERPYSNVTLFVAITLIGSIFGVLFLVADRRQLNLKSLLSLGIAFIGVCALGSPLFLLSYLALEVVFIAIFLVATTNLTRDRYFVALEGLVKIYSQQSIGSCIALAGVFGICQSIGTYGLYTSDVTFALKGTHGQISVIAFVVGMLVKLEMLPFVESFVDAIESAPYWVSKWWNFYRAVGLLWFICVLSNGILETLGREMIIGVSILVASSGGLALFVGRMQQSLKRWIALQGKFYLSLILCCFLWFGNEVFWVCLINVTGLVLLQAGILSFVGSHETAGQFNPLRIDLSGMNDQSPKLAKLWYWNVMLLGFNPMSMSYAICWIIALLANDFLLAAVGCFGLIALLGYQSCHRVAISSSLGREGGLLPVTYMARPTPNLAFQAWCVLGFGVVLILSGELLTLFYEYSQ